MKFRKLSYGSPSFLPVVVFRIQAETATALAPPFPPHLHIRARFRRLQFRENGPVLVATTPAPNLESIQDGLRQRYLSWRFRLWKSVPAPAPIPTWNVWRHSMNTYECMYEYGNYAFHLELFSGEVSLLGVGLHFKFLAALAPEGWPFSDSGFSFLIQVSQNHLPLNSDFSPDLAHLILEILKNLKFWHTFRIFFFENHDF